MNLKELASNQSISDQFKKIIRFYKNVGYKMDIMKQSACLVASLQTQSRSIAMVSSLIAWRWVRPQIQ